MFQVKNIFKLLAIASLALFAWGVYFYYPSQFTENAYKTLVLLSVLYLFFRVLIEGVMMQRIEDERMKYSFRKIIFSIYITLFLVFLVSVWVEDLQALFVAYGLIAAGGAVALQDFFRNIVGGLVLFVRRPYAVGDRIEVNTKAGDVVDIGLLYTTVMEIKEWVDGDQATGRLSTIPNGSILGHHINNYTKDYSFIWDEISIPVKYSSNWQKARDIFKEVADKETEEYKKDAKESLSKLKKRYYILKRETEPSVFVDLTDNWINLSVRYITTVKDRRPVMSNISEKIMEKVEEADDIEIASETLIMSKE